MTTAMPRSAPADLLTIVPHLLAVATAWAAASAFGWRGLIAGTVLVAAAFAAHSDVATRRIPDRLVLLAASPLFAWIAFADDRAFAIATLAGGAAVMAGPLLLLHLVSPAAMGWGDVKLAGVLGAALGVVDVRLGIAALSMASGATLAIALVARRSTLPFAPGLVAGAAAVLAVASGRALEFPR